MLLPFVRKSNGGHNCRVDRWHRELKTSPINKSFVSLQILPVFLISIIYQNPDCKMLIYFEISINKAWCEFNMYESAVVLVEGAMCFILSPEISIPNDSNGATV